MIELVGSALNPLGDSSYIIINPCDGDGNWGTSFQRTLEGHFPKILPLYEQYVQKGSLTMGTAQLVGVVDSTWVANMTVNEINGKEVLLDIDSFKECFEIVKKVTLGSSASIHIPRVAFPKKKKIWDQVRSVIWNIAGNADVYLYYEGEFNLDTIPEERFPSRAQC